ncbi:MULTISPECIES: O-methyltransferase [Streptomyces]|uniref:O-methyltransferase n=1 Tax=Streptomyces TaxID=1883 RepID=UPI0029316B00|nr:class I SAM-dependent methyltransferase [Streptomyces sp. NEAU-HV9]
MDRPLAALLDSLYQEGRAHDGPLADRLLRLRNMTPEAAGLIALLIRAQRAKSVLEIGTSNGYSAIWFADAARDTGGRLTTVETDAVRVEAALRNLERAGVSDHVDVVHGDGGEVLARTEDASVDLVVLDAERPAYVEYWPQLRRVLTRHGMVAVDNAVSHRDQLTAFRALVAETGDFAVDLREVGDGVFTAVRIR